MSSRENRKKKLKAKRRSSSGPGRRCGLCGKAGKLTKTECCGQWICDDEDQYVPFSYARNSCSRNHGRYTLCGYHDGEGHSGSWQECATCREDFEHELEMYVWYGTNEHNFEKLKDPPKYEPTTCSTCGRVIVLGEEGHAQKGGEYWCEECAADEMGGPFGAE